MGIIDKIKSIFGKEEELPKAKVENQNTEQKAQVDDYKIIEDFAKAWQTLDADLIIKHLDESFVYHSQWVVEPQDYARYVYYLPRKFETIKRSGAGPSVNIVPDKHSECGYAIRLQQEGIEPTCYRIKIKDGKVIKGDMCIFEEKSFIEINYQNPPEIFMHARAFAGNSLSEMMRQESPEGKPTPNGYRWVKTDWTYPSFEHFTFAYKNQIFCVLVDMLVGDGHSLDEKSLSNLLREAKRNNLVPCIFPVVLSSDGEDFSPQNTQMSKKSSSWNLFHAETMQAIVPEQISDDTPTQMSEWEMLDFAILAVRQQIEKEGGKIQSYCSVPEIYPNIWFVDKAGNRCWVIVERLPMSIDPKEAASRWYGRMNLESVLRFDGYHAAVDFQSSEPFLCDAQGELIPLSKREEESCPRYRGDGMYVCFRGLERIHVADK